MRAYIYIIEDSASYYIGVIKCKIVWQFRARGRAFGERTKAHKKKDRNKVFVIPIPSQRERRKLQMVGVVHVHCTVECSY